MWDLWEALQNTLSHPTHRAFIHQSVPHWLIWEHYSDSRLTLERPGAERHRSRNAWEQRQGTTASAIGIFLCICFLKVKIGSLHFLFTGTLIYVRCLKESLIGHKSNTAVT